MTDRPTLNVYAIFAKMFGHRNLLVYFERLPAAQIFFVQVGLLVFWDHSWSIALFITYFCQENFLKKKMPNHALF